MKGAFTQSPQFIGSSRTAKRRLIPWFSLLVLSFQALIGGSGTFGLVATATAATPSKGTERTTPKTDTPSPPTNEGDRTPAFAVYATERLVIGDGTKIRGGAVGVAPAKTRSNQGKDFQVEILGAQVDGAVYGDTVRLGLRSRVGSVFTNRLVNEGAKLGPVLPLPRTLPQITELPRGEAGQEAVIVPGRGRVILDSWHTTVTVEPGGTVVLSGGRFDIESLELGEGSRLEVTRPSLLSITQTLKIGAHSYVGPTDKTAALNLTILVAGRDEVGAAAVFGARSEVHAALWVPNGTLQFKDRVTAGGAFHGRIIEIAQKVDLSHLPWKNWLGPDPQCLFVTCDVVAGGQIDCHPEVVAGFSCNDGNACTSGDMCNAAGQCLPGEPVPDPDFYNTNPCVRDTCDPVSGIYEPFGTVCEGAPWIGSSQCYESVMCDGQGSCNMPGPLLPSGTACDDGIPNNGADYCTGSGSCIGPLGAFDCKANTCGGDLTTPPDLQCWLSTHPAIRDRINWRDANIYNILSYPQWTPQQQQELAQAFQAAWQWLANGMTNFQGTPMPEPAPNNVTPPDDQWAYTEFSEPTAWPHYLAHVAHSLAVETRGEVPWSLCDYDQNLIGEILSSTVGVDGHYHSSFVPNYRPASGVTPAHPTVTYSFLVENNLIGTTRFETIAKLIDWGRNLDHYVGILTGANAEGHWQYRGYPPVSRTIEGTVANPAGYAFSLGFGHWTKGCWGTMGFLKSVLLAVNIPVQSKAIPLLECNHATPYFPSEGLYLSHGDDPYGYFYEGTTTVVPALGDILIDQNTYTTWFTGTPDYVCHNVGRRSAELALDLLPDHLAERYCLDVADNNDHANSRVYTAFAYYYTLQELEAANLWSRLSQRATDLGLWCGGM